MTSIEAESSTKRDRFTLEGRIALVTGASSGIGRTLSKGLSEAGAKVIVGARRADRLQGLVDEIEVTGGSALSVQVDVTDPATIVNALAQAEDNFGTVDIVVNNAGISDPGHFLAVTADERDAVLDTNIRGVWNVGQAAAKRMVAAGREGSIINIASVLGAGAQPGLASYCTSKGAVIQLTRSMALDLMKHNVRVNAVAPGWFLTEMNENYFMSQAGKDYIQRTPSRRLGRIEELVGPVVLLASDAGSFMNGSVVTVDGALTALVA